MSMWIDTTNCGQPFHEFKRTERGMAVFHSNDDLCADSEYQCGEAEREEEKANRCSDCGHTPETGACFRCKMD